MGLLGSSQEEVVKSATECLRLQGLRLLAAVTSQLSPGLPPPTTSFMAARGHSPERTDTWPLILPSPGVQTPRLSEHLQVQLPGRAALAPGPVGPRCCLRVGGSRGPALPSAATKGPGEAHRGSTHWTPSGNPERGLVGAE